MVRNLSATVRPGIKTCAVSPRKIHEGRSDQILKSLGRPELCAPEKTRQHSRPLPLQSSQPTLPQADTPPKLDTLNIPVTRNQSRILSKHNFESQSSSEQQRSTLLTQPTSIKSLRPNVFADTVIDTSPSTRSYTSSPLSLTEINLTSFNDSQIPFNTPTPSKSEATSVPSMPDNQAALRRLFRDNHLYIDHDAYEKYPELQGLINGIIGGERNSAAPPASCEEFRDARKKFPTMTEATFLSSLWGYLHDKTREVGKMELRGKKGKIQWVTRAWSMDHLGVNWQAEFLRDSIPPVETDDPVKQALLEDLPKGANPKPDFAFGLAEEAFNESEQEVNHTFPQLTVLSNDLYHVGFIIEGKGSDGTMGDAQCQCCRGGSAMVNARMRFNAESTTKELPRGADLQSIAFSLAITVGSAEMHVHWAEIEGTKKVFHMNFLKDYSLRDRECEGFTRLRRDIDNVLNWVTLKRAKEVKGVCKAIAEKTVKARAQKATQQAPTKKRKAVARGEEAVQEPPTDRRKRGKRGN